MDELMDLMSADNASASEISDKIKDMLFAKSAERVDAYKPEVANSLFGDQEQPETEVDSEEPEEESSENAIAAEPTVGRAE